MRDHNLTFRNATFHFIIELYLHIFNETVCAVEMGTLNRMKGLNYTNRAINTNDNST